MIEEWQNRGYVEITDTGTEEHLGTYGRNTVPVLRSTSNQVLIRVVTASIPIHLSMEYTTEPLEEVYSCGVPNYVTYKEDQGEIVSPNYPNSYPSNQECVWYLVTEDPALFIVLNFDEFHLEDESTDGHCRNDFVEVHDGHTLDSPLIGTYCGSRVPDTIVSQSKALAIKFKSDHEVQDKGFILKYEAKCYRVFDGPSGVITSMQRIMKPGCTMEIKGSENTAMTLNFTSLGIVTSRDITWSTYSYLFQVNYIDILVGKNKDHVARYHDNTLAPSVTLPTGHIFIVHVSREINNNHKIFNITYQEEEIQCRWPDGDLYSKDLGQLESPWLNSAYPGNQSCRWTITNTCGLPVRMNVTSVSLDPDKTSSTSSRDANYCTPDFLQVDDDDENVENRFCDLDEPKSFISSSEKAIVKFTSGVRGGTGTFSISYDEGCGIVDVQDGVPTATDNNYDVVPGAGPWMAIVYTESGEFCSGTLLNNIFVMITTQCLWPLYSNKPLYVKLGKTFTNTTEDYEVTFNVTDKHYFGYQTLYSSLYLLRLDRAVEFNSFIRPLCLPTHEVLTKIRAKAGTLAYTFGWGRDYENTTNHQILQRIPLRLVKYSECVATRNDYFSADKDYLCAGYLDENDGGNRCYGHGSGPLAKYYNGKWYMIGIVASYNSWPNGNSVVCPRRGKYGWFWRTVKADYAIKNRVCEHVN
ncbi:cubilin-like [Glandiceps talaboti]